MKIKIKNGIGIVLYLLAGIRLGIALFFSSVTAVWFDEIYSLVFAFRPVRELISLTAKDVHPPLYYIILRAFLLLFDKIFPFMKSEQVGKIVTIIPFFLILIYAITIVRKQYGFFVSALFFFCVCSMPQDNLNDIRMYSWALLFITGLGLHFCDVITAFFNNKNSNLKNYIFILLYSVAALYTHYFAAIAVFWIYVGALLIMVSVYIISGKKEPENNWIRIAHMIKLIAIGVLAIVCYVPWISVLLSQLGDVKESYWIEPIGPKAPYNTVMHIIRAHYSNIIIGTILSLIFVTCMAILLYKEILKVKKGHLESVYIIYLFSILPLVALTGYIVSILMRPIFIDRYLLPSIGLFWLSISIIIGNYFNENLDFEPKINYKLCILCYLLIFMLLNASVDLINTYNYESGIKNREPEFVEMLSQIDENDVLITNLDHIQGVVSYLLNTDRRVKRQGENNDPIADYKVYLYDSDEKLLLSEVLPGFCNIKCEDEISDFINEGRKVLFLQYTFLEDAPTSMNELYNMDLNFDFIGSYLYENYYVHVYLVS